MDNVNKETLEIIREKGNEYANILRSLWNTSPEQYKPMLIYVMETMASAVRKTWPEIGTMTDMLGEIFSSTIIGETGQRKDV